MSVATERRAFRVVGWIACLVPLVTGSQSVVRGVAMLRGAPNPPPPDLDSHFRYLSGIFLALGIAFAWSILRIERRGGVFRLLCLMVISGGLARLVSLLAVGTPSRGHMFGLAMELGTVPLLLLWQMSLARRAGWTGRSNG